MGSKAIHHPDVDWCTIAPPRVCRSTDPSACLVVMYHYLRTSAQSGSCGVRGPLPGEFCSQLDLLCRELEPISWPDLYAWSLGRADIPERCFLLTFDDGLMDHALAAVPILEERGLRGVFFVPGRSLGSRTMLSAHAIHLLLEALGCETLSEEVHREVVRLEGSGGSTATADKASAERMYHYEEPAQAHLKYLLTVVLDRELRNQIVGKLFEQHVGPEEEWARRWYMGWNELARMQASGHTIGGHGYAHEPYGRLNKAEIGDDLARSASILCEGLGPEMRPFSYPYGSCDQHAADACRAAGFVHAFTTSASWVSKDCDWGLLPRVDAMQINKSVVVKEAKCQPQ